VIFPIFTLSAEEQARVLALADVALHAGTSHEGQAYAGDRAGSEHERLKQELRNVVESSNARDAAGQITTQACEQRPAADHRIIRTNAASSPSER
jgi:hypothetical protein